MWYVFTGSGPDGETLRVSLSAIDRVTEAYCLVESAGVPTYLVGFSQGATLSLAFASMRPERIRGVVALSGFLVEDSLLPGPIAHLRGMKIFLSHGRSDKSIPLAWAQAAEARLQAAGASVRFDIHDGGHAVPEEVWGEVREWMMNDIKDFRAGHSPEPKH